MYDSNLKLFIVSKDMQVVGSQIAGFQMQSFILQVKAGQYTSKDAIKYLVLVNETVGEEWLSPDLFRFGASTLLNDLVLQRQRMLTGHYSGPDYVTID